MRFSAVFSVSLLFLLSSASQAQQITYSYDQAGRLLAVNYGNSTELRYTYDDASNPISISRGSVSDFSITNLGGVSLVSDGSGSAVKVGYGRVTSDGGSSTPSGISIFGFTQGGVLVTEAGVPAASPIQEGRIFAEVNSPVNTGLAIANPNDVSAMITFSFTDVNGVDFGSGSFTLGANEQTAKFLVVPVKQSVT